MKEVLRKGDKGEAVKELQSQLNRIGYNCGTVDGIFGDKTYKAVIDFQKDNDLSADGVVGKNTYATLEKYNTFRKGDKGETIKELQNQLNRIGYNCGTADGIFGEKTHKAVVNFQKDNGLVADGVVDEKTYEKIKNPKQISLNKFTNISKQHRKDIEKELNKVSKARQDIVLEILKYAYDKDKGGEPIALYVFGENLYNENKKINYGTAEKINYAAKRYPKYFNYGRKEWMLEQIKNNSKMPISDCSGLEVGYLRKFNYVNGSFDTTANELCTNSKYSKKINKSDLKPGDWVGKEGHIGTYVGAGLVVEFYGGAYGCQLTNLNDRVGYNFINKKEEKGGGWTRYAKPKYY